MDKKIDLERYMGIWYEIARVPYDKQNGLFNCKAEYTMKRGYVSVMNSGIYEDSKRRYTWAAKLKPIQSVDNVYVLEGEEGSISLYQVMCLSDDYKYSIVTNAKDLVWVLCRDKTMGDAEYAKILDIISKNGIDSKTLVKTKQI